MSSMIAVFLSGSLVYASNHGFRMEALFLKPAYEVPYNKIHINDAIALKAISDQESSLAVFSAGVVPYYTGMRAIDMLGKSDPVIASLQPDLRLGIGHNKYDLYYSIVKHEPTYVQGFRWGSQDLTSYAEQNYVNVDFRGIRLWLRKRSPHVAWQKLNANSPESQVVSERGGRGAGSL